MRFDVLAVGVLVVMLGACAAPNTPGAGSGYQYTPVIDLRGVDRVRYSADLSDCRGLAQSVSIGGEAASEGLARAAIGAAMAAALRLPPDSVGRVAEASAAGGVGKGLRVAEQRQRGIMINCMASRGYRTLDGGNIVVMQQQQPGMMASAQAPMVAAQWQPQTVTYPRAQEPVTAVTESPKVQGKFSYEAEKLGRGSTCNAAGAAIFGGSGPGWESYTLQCASGAPMMVRCDYGACREVK